MLYHLVVGILGTAALLGGWGVVQGLKRRSDPNIAPGEDVLACGRCEDEHGCACAAMIAVAERPQDACVAHHEE